MALFVGAQQRTFKIYKDEVSNNLTVTDTLTVRDINATSLIFPGASGVVIIDNTGISIMGPSGASGASGVIIGPSGIILTGGGITFPDGTTIDSSPQQAQTLAFSTGNVSNSTAGPGIATLRVTSPTSGDVLIVGHGVGTVDLGLTLPPSSIDLLAGGTPIIETTLTTPADINSLLANVYINGGTITGGDIPNADAQLHLELMTATPGTLTGYTTVISAVTDITFDGDASIPAQMIELGVQGISQEIPASSLLVIVYVTSPNVQLNLGARVSGTLSYTPLPVV